MPNTTIEAVYEHGVLCLSRPIDLAEGTRVDVIVIPQESPQESDQTDLCGDRGVAVAVQR